MKGFNQHLRADHGSGQTYLLSVCLLNESQAGLLTHGSSYSHHLPTKGLHLLKWFSVLKPIDVFIPAYSSG